MGVFTAQIIFTISNNNAITYQQIVPDFSFHILCVVVSCNYVITTVAAVLENASDNKVKTTARMQLFEFKACRGFLLKED